MSLGFFSYSLPLDPASSRAWRIVWDPLFFEFCQAAGGRLWFDLDVYRQLDCASRRLFLLLHKVFWRRVESPRFDIRHLAVNALGFSPGLWARSIKEKIKRCAEALLAVEVIAMNGQTLDAAFRKHGTGEYAVRFLRGAYFDGGKRGRRIRQGRRLLPSREEARRVAPRRAFASQPSTEALMVKMTAHFRAAGQSPTDARRNAERFALEHGRRISESGDG